MAVTLNQMAEAYLASVEQQLQQAKDQANQAVQYAQQIEAHLAECKNSVSQDSDGALARQSPFPGPVESITTHTETVQLPNPFEKSTDSE